MIITWDVIIFISWDVIKLWNGAVPTLFVVPRPELVLPPISNVCTDAQVVKFIELAAKDNVDGAMLTDFVKHARGTHCFHSRRHTHWGGR